MRNFRLCTCSIAVMAVALLGCATQVPVDQPDPSSNQDVVDRQAPTSPGDEVVEVPHEFTTAFADTYETCSCGFECQYYTCECNGSSGCCEGCCDAAEDAAACNVIVVRPKHPIAR
jgi:hypothetical protein